MWALHPPEVGIRLVPRSGYLRPLSLLRRAPPQPSNLRRVEARLGKNYELYERKSLRVQIGEQGTVEYVTTSITGQPLICEATGARSLAEQNSPGPSSVARPLIPRTPTHH